MKIKRRKELSANIGLLAVGHHTYWKQFDGLLEEMKHKIGILEKKVEKNGVNVIKFGLIDNAEGAYRIVSEIKKAELDVLFIDMVTYATSSTFGIIVREINVPIVLLALQPLSALDYAKASTFMQLCNDDFCSVPEFTGVAMRMGRKIPELIIGQLENDAEADREIAEWCSIAHVLHDLKKARIGHMGHVLEAMLDMHTDPTAVTSTFGSHVVQCEPDEIMKHFRNISGDEKEVKEMRRRILEFFDTPDPVSDPITVKLTEEDLDTAAKAAVALEKFIQEKKLDGLAYYYEAEEGS